MAKHEIQYPAPIQYPNYETLALSFPEPNILQVTLNRPKQYNALSHKLVDEMTDLCEKLQQDFFNVRVILLYGGDEGKGFCAGLDVKEGLTDYEKTVPGFYAYQIKLGEMELKMTLTPQPWIALIDNVSAGGGFSLAMASDIRVCTKTAKFSCFYANVGIGGCDMCSSYQLPRLIGTGRAYEMMLTGNFISSEEAWNLGLVSKVVDDRAGLVPAGLALARVIAAKEPLAVRLTKEAMRANVDASGFHNALHVENRNQTLMIANNMWIDSDAEPIGTDPWIEQDRLNGTKK
jgi:enoyl-CoA hydratase/carnithine racemase